MNKEIEHYSYKFYNEYSLLQKEKERIDFLISKIPKINNVLEIGCANGRLINKLNVDFKVGIDIALEPLKYVKGLSYAANVCNIPFVDNCFELVICSEILEHLNQKRFQEAIEEISRVSNHYILISVPYKEQLERKFVKCVKCKNIFHVYMHKTSFSSEDLLNLFDNFKLISFYSYSKVYYTPLIFDKLRKYTNNYFVIKNVFCPNCGTFDACKRQNVLGRFINMCERLFDIIFFFKRKKEPKWIITIFEKKRNKSNKKYDDPFFNILICPLCREKINVSNQLAICPNNHKFYYKENILDLRV